ncbi:MAG: hypothetical protein AAFV07_05565 [Bacteroidota bacterium]
MYKEVLRSIEHAEVFAAVVVVVFVVFFSLLFFHVMRMNRNKVAQIAALPLHDGQLPAADHHPTPKSLLT